MLVLTISVVIVVAFASVTSPWALAQARFSYAAKMVLLRLATVTGLPGRQQLWVMSTHALSLGGGSDVDSYMTTDDQQRSRNVSADSAREAPAQLTFAVDAATGATAPAPSPRSGDIETPVQGQLFGCPKCGCPVELPGAGASITALDQHSFLSLPQSVS